MLCAAKRCLPPGRARTPAKSIKKGNDGGQHSLCRDLEGEGGGRVGQREGPAIKETGPGGGGLGVDDLQD